jgi:putative phosphonate metabolism protein
MRVAIFFTPPATHALTRAAAAWLTRDAFSDKVFATPDDEILPPAEIVELTAEPRRYGFHATLKAPFRLADGLALGDLEAALAAFCRRSGVIRLPRLRIERLGAFFALTPATPDVRLQAFAAELVHAFDRYRAPLTPAELARRRRTPLTPRQEEHLGRWGYPYVMDEFRFHMTLTGPVPVERQEAVAESLARRFSRLLARTIDLDTLALFAETAPDAGFRVHARHRLDGAAFTPMALTTR